MVNNVENLSIPEIYINSDMILSFDEDSCNWNETNAMITTPKSMSTNIHSTSNKLNVNVNVNVNRNVSYNHGSTSSATVNSCNLDEELNCSETNQTKVNESAKKVTIENRRVLDLNENNEDEISSSIKASNSEYLNKEEIHNIKTGSNSKMENSDNLHFSSFIDTDCIEFDLKDKSKLSKDDSKIIKRRRNDPKLCWRCHKRDATPHMRSCEPCRVADRQRWSRRRNLSKFISDSNNLITSLDLNANYAYLKEEARIGISTENSKSEGFLGSYIQNNMQLKHDTNQYMIGTPESLRSINSNITHSSASSPLSGISLKCPLIKEQWHEQQFQIYRDNRASQSYNEIQSLSYITITYYPSSFSGLTSLPVSAKFASDGSINGLETLPSVVLSFIVDKCNEQLLQRQIIRQNTQHVAHNNNLISPQLESGVGNILTNNNEIHKGVVGGGGTYNSFHNIHCSNFHCNSLDPRFYC